MIRTFMQCAVIELSEVTVLRSGCRPDRAQREQRGEPWMIRVPFILAPGRTLSLRY